MPLRRDTLINWINLRTLFVGMTLAVMLLPQRPSYTAWLDYYLFRIGVNLMQAKEDGVDIALVTLPEQEAEFLRRDLGQAALTQQLLDKLLANDVTTGLVVDQAPAQISPWARTVIADLSNDKSVGKSVKNASGKYINVENKLRRAFDNKQLVIGSPNATIQENLLMEAADGGDVIQWLPPWRRPQPPTVTAIAEEKSQQPLYATADFDRNRDVVYPLLWQSHDQVAPGFLLKLYSRLARSESLTWYQYGAVDMGVGLVFPLSPDGSFIPFYNHWSGQLDSIRKLTIEEAIDSAAQFQLALVGVFGVGVDGVGATTATQLETIARALLSLEHQAYFYQPAWFGLLEIGLTILILLYLTLLLPRLASLAGLLASCLIIILLLVMQVGWQITQWQWLSMGLLIQLIILGHALIALWKYQREKLLQAQAAAHGARYQLGLQLFRDGRGDDALLAIKECFVSDAVAQLMYEIASQQERKRQYGAAIKTYQTLNRQKKRFRDVAEKIEKLIAFSSGTASTMSGDGDIAKTLLISESTINKPVLGRYEIERELGRGAMGVVYLGRDPKISRQVAIKTLSYSNIYPDHLDEFKERFFREAEAAGRLSHPNIVTIYDVGEEHDLAFIAMDYIEGKALNTHVSEDTLLPITEVYQIVIEVADGLSYAHQKHIIHRDIKPGNIMYQAENGIVKITDFGVARMVDSTRTNTGDILGSPLYMSPEQLEGNRVTAQTDIYSLGVTLYQLLSGKLPFSGDSLANLTYNIIHEKHRNIRDWRPELPRSATRIINKALNKDPEKRFHKVKDFADALRRSLAEDFN